MNLEKRGPVPENEARRLAGAAVAALTQGGRA